MHNVPFTKLLLASAIAMTLAACGSDDNDTPATPPPVVVPPVVEAGDTVMLTATGRIVSLNADNTVRTNVALSGLQASETLLGIDFRPLDGLLYGVGSSGRIYTVNPSTGAASLRSTLAADAADTSAPFTALAGTDYAVDFNPAADRLRVVSDSGQNLRINVESGATTTDGNINGGPATAKITSAAYTNSFAGTSATTLFVIDAAASTLYTQNPPNNGTLSVPVALGVTASAVGGFDIDARSNRGLAVLTVGGKAGLYAINLAATANPATLVAALDLSDAVKGLAVRSPAAPVATSTRYSVAGPVPAPRNAASTRPLAPPAISMLPSPIISMPSAPILVSVPSLGGLTSARLSLAVSSTNSMVAVVPAKLLV